MLDTNLHIQQTERAPSMVVAKTKQKEGNKSINLEIIFKLWKN